MDLDDADAFRAIVPAVGEDVSEHLILPWWTGHHGVHDEARLAGAFGDFAEHGIEQERHVVVDDRDHRHRPADRLDARLGADVGDAGARQMPAIASCAIADRLVEVGFACSRRGPPAALARAAVRAECFSPSDAAGARLAAAVFVFTAMASSSPACFCPLS